MTTISDIADAIAALINSKMRSPTKAEIEEVLVVHLEGFMAQTSGTPTSGLPWFGIANNTYASNATPPLPDPKDWVQAPADCGSVFSLFKDATQDIKAGDMVKLTVTGVEKWEHPWYTSGNTNYESWTADPLTGSYQLTQEDLEAAADAICAAEDETRKEHAAWMREQERARRFFGDFNPLEGFKALSNPRDHWEKGAVGLDAKGLPLAPHPAKNCDRDGHQFSVRDVCDRCGTTLLEALGQIGQTPKV